MTFTTLLLIFVILTLGIAVWISVFIIRFLYNELQEAKSKECTWHPDRDPERMMWILATIARIKADMESEMSDEEDNEDKEGEDDKSKKSE